jgi:hypothetical protein
MLNCHHYIFVIYVLVLCLFYGLNLFSLMMVIVGIFLMWNSCDLIEESWIFIYIFSLIFINNIRGG